MSTPVLSTPVVNDDLSVSVVVDDLGGNAFVRVDYAVSSASTAPSIDSMLWRVISTIGTISTVSTGRQTYNTTIWLRASGRDALGERTSAYSTALPVDIEDIPRFTSTGVSLQNGVPIVFWTPSILTQGVKILWEVHQTGTEIGTPTGEVELIATASPYTISEQLAVGETISILIEAWSDWDSASDIVTGDQGEVLALSAFVAAPSVNPLVVRSVTTYEYTLQLIDANAFLTLTDPSNVVLVIPTDASVNFSIGTPIWVRTGDAPILVTTEESDFPVVTSLNGYLVSSGQFGVMLFVKIGPNLWSLSGDLS